MGQTTRQLDLDRLRQGCPPGVTPNVGAFTAEAAAVLLQHNKHCSGVVMEVVEEKSHSFLVTWSPVHSDAQRSHNDLTSSAEHGAYGIAFLLAEQLTRFQIIERSWKGTGFDYWLGTGDSHPFQRAARMEVSGIVNDADAINARVKVKIRQTRRSDSSLLPAFVAVIEFGQPKGVFKRKS